LESPYSITSNAVAVDILELEIYWLELCLCQLGLGYFRIKYRVENGFYILGGTGIKPLEDEMRLMK